MIAISVAGTFFPNIHFWRIDSPKYNVSLWLTIYKWLANPYLSYPFTANYPQVFSVVSLSSFSNIVCVLSAFLILFLDILVFPFNLVFKLKYESWSSWHLYAHIWKPIFILFQVHAYMYHKNVDLSQIGRVSLLQCLLFIPLWRFNQVWLMVNKGLEDKWNSQWAVMLTSLSSSSPIIVFQCLSMSAEMWLKCVVLHVYLLVMSKAGFLKRWRRNLRS